MKDMRTIIFILCLFIPHVSLMGQKVIEALPRWIAGAHVHLIYPDEPFVKTSGKVGYQFEFQYRVKYNQPFLAGVFYNESTLSKYVLPYTQSSGSGDIHVKEKANTRRIEPGITAGFYPEVNWLIQPYVIGRFGVAIFQTSSILKEEDTGESIERISELTTAAPSYGLDIGFHVIPNIWYLRWDVRFGFYGNTSTTYMLLNEEDAASTGYPIDYFDTYTSAGKWWKISAGISYLF